MKTDQDPHVDEWPPSKLEQQFNQMRQFAQRNRRKSVEYQKGVITAQREAELGAEGPRETLLRGLAPFVEGYQSTWDVIFAERLKAAREQGVQAASIDIENGVVFHRDQSSDGQPSLSQQEYIDGYYSGWSEIYRVRAETLRVAMKQSGLSREVLKDLYELNIETLRRWKEVDTPAVKSFLGMFNGFKIPRKGFNMSFGDFRANELLDQHVFRFREGKNPLPMSQASTSFTIVPISI